MRLRFRGFCRRARKKARNGWKRLSKMKHIHGHKMCPFCGGNVEYAGISSGHIFPDINTGQMYLCKECGYQGSFIMEFDDPDDERKIKEYMKTNRKGFEMPAFSLPEKWQWFWKLMLVILVAVLAFGIIIELI